MSLVKFRNAAVSNPFDALINDFFEGEFLPRHSHNRAGSLPATNIREDEKSFYVELAAPGMKKDDFKIELNENLLSIRTENKESREERKDRYTKREFNYTSFVRSFRLPEDVNIESIAASYVDGILSLEIPKVETPEKTKVRQIAVN